MFERVDSPKVIFSAKMSPGISQDSSSSVHISQNSISSRSRKRRYPESTKIQFQSVSFALRIPTYSSYPIRCGLVEMRVWQEEGRADVPLGHCVGLVSGTRMRCHVTSQCFGCGLYRGLAVAASLGYSPVSRGVVLIQVTVAIMVIVAEPIGSRVLVSFRLIVSSVGRLNTDRIVEKHQIVLLQVSHVHFLYGIVRVSLALHRRSLHSHSGRNLETSRHQSSSGLIRSGLKEINDI